MKTLIFAALLMAPTAFVHAADQSEQARPEATCQNGTVQPIPNDGYCDNGQNRNSVYTCENGQWVLTSYTCGGGGH